MASLPDLPRDGLTPKELAFCLFMRQTGGVQIMGLENAIERCGPTRELIEALQQLMDEFIRKSRALPKTLNSERGQVLANEGLKGGALMRSEFTVDLGLGTDRDIFGKTVVHRIFRGARVDVSHNNPPGQARGDGGDATILGRRGAPAAAAGGVEWRIEAKTCVPHTRERVTSTGRGTWRPSVGLSRDPRLIYVFVLFRIKKPDASTITLRNIARCAVGWVVVLENATTLGARPSGEDWTSGPTLNPAHWERLPRGSPPYLGNKINKLVPVAAVWVPGQVPESKRGSDEAYWDVIDGIGTTVEAWLNA